MPCRCEGTRSTAPHRWSIRCPYTSRPPQRSRSQRHKDTADLTFAVDDAFKHARRQLQDLVRRIQGHIKDHQDSEKATVARIDPSGEFGFLETGDGQEIYFHRNSVVGRGASKLQVGSRVTYVEELGEKGPQATTVKVMGKHSLRA